MLTKKSLVSLKGHGVRISYNYITKDHYDELLSNKLNKIIIEPFENTTEINCCYGVTSKTFSLKVNEDSVCKHSRDIHEYFTVKSLHKPSLIPFTKDHDYAIVLIENRYGEWYRDKVEVPTYKNLIIRQIQYEASPFKNLEVLSLRSKDKILNHGTTSLIKSSYFVTCRGGTLRKLR
jgi:hypothetical protein